MDLIMNKEFYTKKEFFGLAKETAIDMQDLVTATMGPFGNTIILTGDETTVTKDGVSVSESINFMHPVKQAVASIIKEAAREVVEDAGDGTTTCTLLLTDLIIAGITVLQDSNYTFNDIKRELDEIRDAILLELPKHTMNLVDGDILNIAKVSANNDEDIAEVIAKAFQYSDNVDIVKANANEDSVDKRPGIDYKDSGMLMTGIFNKEDNSIEYSNADVLIINGKLEEFGRDLSTIIAGYSTPKQPALLIVADELSKSAYKQLFDLYRDTDLKLAVMKSPGYSQQRERLISDLATYTGATPDSAGNASYNGRVGHVNKVRLTEFEATIVVNKISPATRKLVKSLRSQINRTPKEGRHNLQTRLNYLLGKKAIINVGGNNSVEVDEKYDRYDDAVKAVTCAIEEGVVYGGGVALQNIHKTLSHTIDSGFLRVLLSPTNKIIDNSDGSYTYDEDYIANNKIFDPVKVLRSAIVNSFAVAKTVLSTKGIILSRHLWNNQ
jgi:chaperonin GroEL